MSTALMKRILLVLSILAITLSNAYSEQVIQMKAGKWELISFYELPKDSSIANVVGVGESNQGYITEVWTYDPEQPANENESDLTKPWQHWVDGITLPDHYKMQSIDDLEYGKGYWVKGKKTGNITLSYPADKLKPIHSSVIHPAWNLIGFSTSTAIPYEFALEGTSFKQIWRFNTNIASSQSAGRFESVELSQSNAVINEQFTQLEPGMGYWVYTDLESAKSLGPKIQILLPPDIDAEPTDVDVQESASSKSNYHRRVPGWSADIGDVDINGCGDYDFSETQDTLDFGDFNSSLPVTIDNTGNGILNWKAKVVACEDKHLACSGGHESSLSSFNRRANFINFNTRIYDEERRQDVFSLKKEASGNVTQLSRSVAVSVDRAGLIPGENYLSCIEFTSNSVSEEGEGINERVKTVKVTMQVPDLMGDYKVQLQLDTLSSEAGLYDADQHNPVYYMSLVRDGDGIKAFLDEQRTLLIPSLTYLSGYDIRNPQSNFQLFGHSVLPANAVVDEDGIKIPLVDRLEKENPFDVEVRREFTFIGERSNGKDGLTSRDLKGQYYETISGLKRGEDVRIEGTFIATKIGETALRIDDSKVEKDSDLAVTGSSAADNITIVRDTQTINERISISDLIVSLSIDHYAPDFLSVKLISPLQENGQRKEVILQQASSLFDDIKNEDKEHLDSDYLKDIKIPTSRVPYQSIDQFDGLLASGEWALEITNHSDVAATLEYWKLNIQGAMRQKLEVYLGVNLVDDITVSLSGCGVSLTTQPVIGDRPDSVSADSIEAGDQFYYAEFDGLIPCDYEVKINSTGYQDFSLPIRIEDCREKKTQCNVADYVSQQNISERLLPHTLGGNPWVQVSPVLVEDRPSSSIRFHAGILNVSTSNLSGDSLSWQLYRRNFVEGDSANSTKEKLELVSVNKLPKAQRHSIIELPYLAGINRLGGYVILIRDDQNRVLAASSDLRVVSNIKGQVVNEESQYLQFTTSSSGGVFMDSATYDLDRYPLNESTVSSDTNDSDCFMPAAENIDGLSISHRTNYSLLENKTKDLPAGTDTSILEVSTCNASKNRIQKKGSISQNRTLDAKAYNNNEAAGLFGNHYRAFISVGQPIVGGSAYGSTYVDDELGTKRVNFRMDTGIQSRVDYTISEQ